MTTGWDSLDVKIGFGYNSLDTAAVLTSVIADAKYIRTRRGRTTPLGPFSMGDAEIDLDNRARTYDPGYAPGPYFGQIKALRQVRVTANDSTSTSRDLFRGFIAPPPNGWAFTYPSRLDAEAQVRLVDGFHHHGAYKLATLATPSFGGDLPGDRIGRVLDTMGWPAAWRNIDTGTTILDTTTYGQSALDHIHRVELTDAGNFYVDSAGNATFDARHSVLKDARKTTSQATFDDGASNTNMRVLEWSFGGDLVNHARIGTTAIAPQEFSDATSITDNGEQLIEWLDLFMQNVPEAYSRGEWLVNAYKGPLFAPSLIEVEVTENNTALDAIIKRELLDRVTVSWTPPGGGSANTQDCFIEGIEHDIPIHANPRLWTTRFRLSSASRFGFTDYTQYLKLDDAALGKLNTGKLAF